MTDIQDQSALRNPAFVERYLAEGNIEKARYWQAMLEQRRKGLQ